MAIGRTRIVYGPIWHEREDCKIVAAAEHHEGKGEALSQLYGLKVARDYDAVLENPNVDIVSICTDFYLKRTLIKKALDCGKHVLVDKAIARTVVEAREIVDTVVGASNKVLLTYPTRFSPTMIKLKEDLDQGQIRTYLRVCPQQRKTILWRPHGLCKLSDASRTKWWG